MAWNTYDAINTALFAPTGGSRRLRRQLVESLAVRPGDRALELGCGTGQVTAELLLAGAAVVAVDELPSVLDAARRRAPGATYVAGDLVGVDAARLAGGEGFDEVVLSFVLHNFDGPGRVAVLGQAAGALGRGGRVGVLEWAVPAGPLGGAWRRFLHVLEPSEAVGDVLDGALDADLVAAGLRVEARRSVAAGRAQVLVAART